MVCFIKLDESGFYFQSKDLTWNCFNPAPLLYCCKWVEKVGHTVHLETPRPVMEGSSPSADPDTTLLHHSHTPSLKPSQTPQNKEVWTAKKNDQSTFVCRSLTPSL